MLFQQFVGFLSRHLRRMCLVRWRKGPCSEREELCSSAQSRGLVRRTVTAGQRDSVEIECGQCCSYIDGTTTDRYFFTDIDPAKAVSL